MSKPDDWRGSKTWASTKRKPGESAEDLASRIYGCDSHSETECVESITEALEEVEAQRDAFERAIVGMLATMIPGAGPENAAHYLVTQDTEEKSAHLTASLARDGHGRLLVVVK